MENENYTTYSLNEDCIAKSLTADLEMSELKKKLAVPHLSVLRNTINGLEYDNPEEDGLVLNSINQASGLISVGKTPISAFAIVPEDFGSDGRLDFSYDAETKKLTLGTSDNNLLSVDCKDFIKDGMISSVSCITVDDQKVLRIVWNSDSEKDITDIPVSSLVGGVYRGDGKYITVNDLTVEFDSETFKEDGLSGYDDIYLYCKSLSGDDGTISELSDQISAILHDGKSLKYSAHINNASTISVGFVEYVRETLCRSKVPNGMFVSITFDGFDGKVSCDDGMVLGNGDVIIVHDHDRETPYIMLEDLSVGQNVRVYKSGVSRYEHVKNEQDITHISNWINENFKGFFNENQESIITKRDLVVNSSLSVTNLSVDTIHAENLDYDKVQLKVDENDAVSVITSISETNGIISVEASQLEKSMVNGLVGTLDELCSGLSTKIYIENPDDGLSDYANLSVVKIGKDEYELLVASEKIDGKTVYVVSSDGIDAYGGKIVNLQDAKDISDAVNLGQVLQYVEQISGNIVFVPGEGDGSAKQKQATNPTSISINGVTIPINENDAFSYATTVEGAGNKSGLKAYRYTNTGNVTNSLTFQTAPTGWAKNDVVSFVNKNKYQDKSIIQNIDGNTVTFDSLPFLSVVDENDYDSKTAYVSTKPDVGNIDLGIGAHSEGINTKAINSFAHAEGFETSAIGQYSHAEGRETTAHYSAHAEGRDTTASGEYSHAEGLSSTASGNRSHAEGSSTFAEGYAAHAEGGGTSAKGRFSHSEGYGTSALPCGNNEQAHGTHAEGVQTQAGDGATVTNYSTGLNGVGAHAEGGGSAASGRVSHAEGLRTFASGIAAHAEGVNTEAKNQSEHAQGQYNKSNKGGNTFGNAKNTIHSIGIGDSTIRKNAVEVMQNGDMYVISVGGYTGTEISDSKTIQQTISDLSGKFETLSIDNVSLSSGNGTVSVITSISETNGIISVEASRLETSMVNGLVNTIEQLSSEISTKIYIENPDINFNGYSDLSVVKIRKDEYEQMVAGPGADGKTIYLISSDEIDAYGQKIINVQDASGLSDAVNFGQLKQTSEEIKDMVDSVSTWISSNFTNAYDSYDTILKKDMLLGTNISVSNGISSSILTNGDNCIASGKFSHAEGSNTYALSTASHAEGGGTIAKQLASHAEGVYTQTNGVGSHSEGVGIPFINGTTVNIISGCANGPASHVEGIANIADAFGSHVGGVCTTDDGKPYSFVWQGTNKPPLENTDICALTMPGTNEFITAFQKAQILLNGVTEYKSHGGGTFNINPAPQNGSNDPASGFFIGDKSLLQRMQELSGNVVNKQKIVDYYNESGLSGYDDNRWRGLSLNQIGEMLSVLFTAFC